LKTSDFFQRIAKYLRSIAIYGDSPFMMANYGSSEYAQAFSRIGSLFGNVYIVNETLDIQELTRDENDTVTSFEINYNDTPVKVDKGIISSYRLQSLLKEPISPPQNTEQFLRFTLITKKPVIEAYKNIATITVPPFSLGIENVNPIKIYQ